MNDNRNDPKPLPDDFGMTIPNLRLPARNQTNNQASEADLPTTNLRQAPPPPKQNSLNQSAPPKASSEDFGMTIPNLRVPTQERQPPTPPPPPPSFNDLSPTTDLRLPLTTPKSSSQTDFDSSLSGFQPAENSEPDFGSTISYIPIPKIEPSRSEAGQNQSFVTGTRPSSPAVEKKQNKVPLWAWLLSGGFVFVALLAVAGLLVAGFIIWRDTGFTLVIKGAPPGSTVFVDGTTRGVTSADGSTKIVGIKAGEKRSIKVSHEGFSDFNDAVRGENGETKELVAQMKPNGVSDPVIVKSSCADDPRVCAAEDAALDALDKLRAPFTVDDLVKALNLHIINFETNSADVPPARKRFLEKAAEKFKQLTGKPIVEIGGHTDNVGNAASNLTLSQDRAKAVRGLLVNFGVDPKVLTPKGFGSAKPKTDNSSEEGKFQNRRIEYSVIAR